jgi:hypothetical protein
MWSMALQLVWHTDIMVSFNSALFTSAEKITSGLNGKRDLVFRLLSSQFK